MASSAVSTPPSDHRGFSSVGSSAASSSTRRKKSARLIISMARGILVAVGLVVLLLEDAQAERIIGVLHLIDPVGREDARRGVGLPQVPGLLGERARVRLALHEPRVLRAEEAPGEGVSRRVVSRAAERLGGLGVAEADAEIHTRVDAIRPGPRFRGDLLAVEGAPAIEHVLFEPVAKGRPILPDSRLDRPLLREERGATLLELAPGDDAVDDEEDEQPGCDDEPARARHPIEAACEATLTSLLDRL